MHTGALVQSMAAEQISEEVRFQSEGVELRGLLQRGAAPGAPAVVICHGAFESQASWAWLAGRLHQAGYTTFTFDFPGHGVSQGIRSTANLRTWAYAIRDALSHLSKAGITTFGLAGWGLGGSAAVLAAAHDPRLSCAVVISAPVVLKPPIGDRTAYGLLMVAARIMKGFTRKPLVLSRLNELDRLRLVSDEAANQTYISSPGVREAYRAVPVPDSLDSVWMDITRAAARVAIPVRIIQGADDRVLALDQSQRLFALVRGEKDLVRIPGGGHALHLGPEKDQVYPLILDWMEKHLKMNRI